MGGTCGDNRFKLFGNSEQLEQSHKKDHFADPGKMVGDLISREEAIETVRKANSIGQAHRMLMQLLSAQSTIYGYDIDYLQLIAYLMREKGITQEEAVTRFVDYTWMAEWIRSQVLSEIGREIKEQCGIG